MNDILKKLPRFSHFPTLILLIGYISYWIELYVVNSKTGLSSISALTFTLGFLLALLLYRKKVILDKFFALFQEYKKYEFFERVFFKIALTIIILIFVVIIWALCLPVHLPQEFDSLNYHITLPRQHLIYSSFKHIGWSVADFFLMPIQFSLAPYWLVAEIPNKLPQITFVFGLIFVAINLAGKLDKKSKLALIIVVLAIMGSHGFGIQMPVLMLDIAICYLFIAALDSFLEGNIILSALEFSFFVWSKPFYPPQVFLLLSIILLAIFLAKKLKFKLITLGFEDYNLSSVSQQYLKKLSLYFIIFSIFIAGPFIIKSIYYTGTPLFPFFPGILGGHYLNNGKLWGSIMQASRLHLSTNDAYGSGRSIVEFIRHFWLLAVPESGVNNRYDYPLGLPYLLFLGPFLYFVFNAFKNKRFPILPSCVIVFWLTWWFTSQQSRFLYVPLILIFITVAAKMEHFPRLLISLLILSLALNFVSIFKANYRDFTLPVEQIIRGKDKLLLKMNAEYHAKKRNDTVTLDYRDVAYANFPVKVIASKNSDLRWVLKY